MSKKKIKSTRSIVTSLFHFSQSSFLPQHSEMSNLESPPPSPAHLPPEKLPVNENSEPIINSAVCTSSSADHKPDDGHSRIMENFKGMIFKFAISSSPTRSLSPLQMSLIEKHLDEVFPSFCTPVHPPYTAVSLHFFFLTLCRLLVFNS